MYKSNTREKQRTAQAGCISHSQTLHASLKDEEPCEFFAASLPLFTYASMSALRKLVGGRPGTPLFNAIDMMTTMQSPFLNAIDIYDDVDDAERLSPPAKTMDRPSSQAGVV